MRVEDYYMYASILLLSYLCIYCPFTPAGE